MSKFGSKKKAKHWAERCRDVSISRDSDGHYNITIEGGADDAQFVYVGEFRQDRVIYRSSNRLHVDDIILEVNGKQISGLIRKDVIALIRRSGDPLRLRVTKPGNSLTKDLREFLGARFQKSSIDHELQQTIRDNLYTRTIPCTTRPPRPGETSGVDYTFMSVDEFLALERSNSLLESGLYGGNYYGTPRPPANPDSPELHRKQSSEDMDPGRSGSMKKRRDRKSPVPKSPVVPVRGATLREVPDLPPLGPLPPNWSVAYAEDNEKYFVNHETRETTWLDPRIAKLQDEGRLNLSNEDLPYGWEKRYDGEYGEYYVDHINQRTSYEKPTMDAERKRRRAPPPPSASEAAADAKRREAEFAMQYPDADFDEHEAARNSRVGEPKLSGPVVRPRNRFTPDREKERTLSDERAAYSDAAALENQLEGESIRATLRKSSSQGFGFTIVGGDSPGELLQIKSIVKNSIAAKNGKLRVGDVLVRVNGVCVLTFTHHEVVSLFQNVTVDSDLVLEVCRGYPLPVSDDPNVPVRPLRLKPVALSPTKEEVPSPLPSPPQPGVTRGPGSVGTDPDSPGSSREIIEAHVVKGPGGFGFTIAETPRGQKVKKILDVERCEQLREKDLLVEVNGKSVRNFSHGDIVSVLKGCQRGQNVRFLVERVIRFGERMPENGDARDGGDVITGGYEKEEEFDFVYVRKEIPLRRTARGFGFRLVGGQEEGTQVYIGTIVPGGAADQGRELKENDEIVSVNGQECMMATHQEIVTLLSEAGKAGEVMIGVQRRVPRKEIEQRKEASVTAEEEPQRSSVFSESNPREITLERRPEGGFGFVLQSSIHDTGCSICRLVPGSPADLCKDMSVGDKLLAVNGKDVTKLHHTDVVGIIKRSGLRVSLKVLQMEEVSPEAVEPPSQLPPQPPQHYTPAQEPPPPPPDNDHVPSPHEPEEPVSPSLPTESKRHGGGSERDYYDGRDERPRYEESPRSRRRHERGEEYSGRGRYRYEDEIETGRYEERGYDRYREHGRRYYEDERGYQEERDRGRGYHDDERDYRGYKGHEGGGHRRHRDEREKRHRERDPRYASPSSRHRHERERERRRHHRYDYPGELNNQTEKNYRSQRHHGGRGRSPSPERGGGGFNNMDPRMIPAHEAELDHRQFGSGELEHEPMQAHGMIEMGEAEENVIDVALQRGQEKSFGFSIRGGREYQNTPLFILKIAEDGVAARDGRLQVGDEILEINRAGTMDMRHTEAISLIKRGGDAVHLKVYRPPPVRRPEKNFADGHLRREVSPPRHYPTVSQAVDSYYDQYMDTRKPREDVQPHGGDRRQNWRYYNAGGYNGP